MMPRVLGDLNSWWLEVRQLPAFGRKERKTSALRYIINIDYDISLKQ